MGSGSSHKIQVFVALIGLLGVIATAVFSNWDKIFPLTPKTVPTRSTEGVQQPKKEKAAAAAGKVLFNEAFEDNANGWGIWKPGTNYDAYLEDGKYVIETKNEKNSPEVIPMKLPRPESFDREVSAIWRSGVKNHRYGLVLGVDRDSYYTFGVSANGQAVVGINKGGVGEGIPDPIDWKPSSAREGDGFSFNRLKIEVRSEKISYYVNGMHIGDISNTIILDKWAIGVMVQSRQKVAFDNLVVTTSPTFAEFSCSRHVIRPVPREKKLACGEVLC